MTTIITRLYADEATAASVVATLASAGIDGDMVQIIKSADHAAMKAARIADAAAAAYAAAMTGGQALVVVTAGFNPVGAARKAIQILNRTAAVNAGVADEEAYVQEEIILDYSGRVMEGAPLLMTNRFAKMSHGHIFGADPISRKPRRNSAYKGGGYMSKMFWPMKLVSTPRTSHSAIAGGKLMSNMFGFATLYRR